MSGFFPKNPVACFFFCLFGMIWLWVSAVRYSFWMWRLKRRADKFNKKREL